MNVEQMKFIVEVSKTRSLKNAALNLNVSSSAISQSISSLEKELGVKVFNRAKSGTSLTSEGTIVFQKAAKVLATLEELPQELTVLNDREQNKIRIGFPPTMSYIVYDAFLSIKEKNIDINIELKEMPENEILEYCRTGQIDLGISSIFNQSNGNDEYEFDFLYKSHVCICVGMSSPLRFYESIRSKDLVNQKLATLDNPYHQFYISKICLNNNDVFLTSNNSTLIRKTIKEGLAITVLDDFTLKNHPDVTEGTLFIIPFKDPDYIYRDFWFIRSKTNIRISYLANEILKAIKDKLTG